MRSTKTLIRYLIIGIPSALGIGIWPLHPTAPLIFYEDTDCYNQLGTEDGILWLQEGQLSLNCIPIPKTDTQNASGIRIMNPNPCVVRIFQENSCDKMIAYAMHWNGEPSCFPLSGAVDGAYYASIGCIPGPWSTSATIQTARATL